MKNKLVVENLYGRDITNLIDNWYYLPNGLRDVMKNDFQRYQEITKKIIYHKDNRDITKTIITDTIVQITPDTTIEEAYKYLNELEYYSPLLLAENNWFESLEMAILYCLIRVYKPKILLETGSNIGHSTFFSLMAIKLNGVGKLYCLDLCGIGDIAEEAKVHITQGFCWSNRPIIFNGKYEPMMLEFVPKCLTEGTLEFIKGDSKITLPKFVNDIGAIDYFFHDSDHSNEHMHFEYNTVKDHMAIGGIFASHDIICKDVWQVFMRDNPNFEHVYQWHTGIAQRVR